MKTRSRTSIKVKQRANTRPVRHHKVKDARNIGVVYSGPDKEGRCIYGLFIPQGEKYRVQIGYGKLPRQIKWLEGRDEYMMNMPATRQEAHIVQKELYQREEHNGDCKH